MALLDAKIWKRFDKEMAKIRKKRNKNIVPKVKGGTPKKSNFSSSNSDRNASQIK